MTTLRLPRQMTFRSERLKPQARENRGSRIRPAPFKIARVGALVIALATVCGSPLRAQSLFTQKPDEPGAVVVTPAVAVKLAGETWTIEKLIEQAAK